MSLVERVAEALLIRMNLEEHTEKEWRMALQLAQAVLEAQGLVTCQTCGGRGIRRPEILERPCLDCRGLGVVPSEATNERAATAMRLMGSCVVDWSAHAKAGLLAAYGDGDA